MVIAILTVSCAGRKAAYDTLYTIGKTTDSAMKSYVDLVVKKKISTNSVPAVTATYNKYQLVYRMALTVATNDVTAPAPVNVVSESATFIKLVTDTKKVEGVK